MSFAPAERAFLERSRVGRLATADADGRPHAVPICYALVENAIVSAIDEKPQTVGPYELRRVRNITTNPQVSLIVDRYTDDWNRLAWVQIDGHARIIDPGSGRHPRAIRTLREKYVQYADHPLDERPAILIEPERVASWGALPAGD